MIYVFTDADGFISSSHNDETVTELPTGAIELSESEWHDRLRFRRVNGQWVEIPKKEEEHQEKGDGV